MELITCKDICLGYENHIISSEITFTVRKGDYLAVVGENGTGKSTLIKCILGLLHPLSGELTIAGQAKMDGIGYLPQQTEAQKDFPASVFEVVLSGCLKKKGWKPFYGSAEKKEAADQLNLLQIMDLKHRCYRELSGGQQQKVLLARAMCATGGLLIMDEPVTGLDPVAAGEFYRLVDMLNKKKQCTIVMISHDIQSVLKEAKTILHLDRTPIYCGSVEGYRKSRAGEIFAGGKGNA